MFKTAMLFINVILFSMAVLFANENEVSKEQITETIVRSENIFESYIALTRIEYYESGYLENTADFLIGISSDKAVAVYNSPIVDKGKAILQKDGGYFLFFPKAQSTIRISASARLFGNVSYSDIVKPPLLIQYSINTCKTDKTPNGDLICRVAFTVKPGISGIAYARREVVYNLTKNRIDTMEAYSRSSMLLCRSINQKYINIKGYGFPTETVILDMNNNKNYAKSFNKMLKMVKIPEIYFNPSNLQNVEKYLVRYNVTPKDK